MNHTYSYDSLNRLQHDGTSSWGYDAADRPTEHYPGNGNRNVSAYNTGSELTSFQVWSTINCKTGTPAQQETQSETLTYNANGDRTGQSDSLAKTSSAFAYDQADRLISYKGSASASYAYNGDGLRMTKTAADRAARAAAAPWYKKAVPWAASKWSSATGTLWGKVEDFLSGVSRALGLGGIGTTIFGYICG